MSALRTFLLLTIFALAGFETVQPIKPFVKGSFAEIQQGYSSKPYLVMFWGQDCAYCMKELAMFGQLFKQYPNVKLITVATDPFLDEEFVRAKLASFDLDDMESWIFASDYPETLYFDVDRRWRGELPLTFLFDRDNNKIKKSGLLSEQELRNWLDQQTPAS